MRIVHNFCMHLRPQVDEHDISKKGIFNFSIQGPMIPDASYIKQENVERFLKLSRDFHPNNHYLLGMKLYTLARQIEIIEISQVDHISLAYL